MFRINLYSNIGVIIWGHIREVEKNMETTVLGFRALRALGFRVQGWRFRVWRCLGFTGLGFRVSTSWFS